MKIKIRILLLLIFLFISFSYSKHLYLSQDQSIIKNINNKNKQLSTKEKKEINYKKIVSDLFYNFNKKCAEDLKILEPEEYNMKMPSKFPVILSHIGLSVNDIEDEIECLHSLVNTIYVIVVINLTHFINPDDLVLLKFLNLKTISVGGCGTEACKELLLHLAYLFQSFSNQNTINERQTLKPDIIMANKSDVSPNEKIYIILFDVFIVYIVTKFIFGIFRLVSFQKGYELYVAKQLNKQGNLHNFDDNIDFSNENNLENEYLNNYDYNPKYDISQYYPKYLRILRFFDIFNDIMLLTKRRNRYYNDNGLEYINFLRAIVLYFYIFSNTFTSLLAMPSKDIFNKSFLSSNYLFFYRLSTYAGISWIFLEGSYTAYKLMKFFNYNMREYHRKNKNKNYELKVLIIFIKFTFLFIPKICIFIFCYFIFYYDIKKFSSWFSAKTTFKFIVERVITKEKTCSESLSFIFKSFFTFTNDSSNFKVCYDFTFIYINILFCILVILVSLYVIFLIRKSIVELFFMLLYFVFFFGLTLMINDENNNSDIYNYYHLKGQEYATKIAYLSLGVYNLGFILGILCFNYDHLKTRAYDKILKINKKTNNEIINDNKKEENKSEKAINDSIRISRCSSDDTKISESYEERAYYPLSFLNDILIAIHKKKSGTKIFIILFCFALQLLLSGFFKIYGSFAKNKSEFYSKRQKNSKDYDPNFETNYVLEMKFNGILKGYFLFEKHIFLILFFIICIILITFPKNGLFYKLNSSKLITAISRTGFTIICLSHILSSFFFIGLNKIKFSILSFLTLSTGNFLIIFFICFLINIIFELPLRRIIKKILRNKSNQYNNKPLNRQNNNLIDINSVL